MLFVTASPGILDLETGELEYCNAGHENPFLVDPSNPGVRRLADGDGPPLCVVSDFAYEGRALCDASRRAHLCRHRRRDGSDEPFGRALWKRARATILPRLASADASALDVVKALRADVDAFAAGATPRTISRSWRYAGEVQQPPPVRAQQPARARLKARSPAGSGR
jgi:hypothetical protein